MDGMDTVDDAMPNIAAMGPFDSIEPKVEDGPIEDMDDEDDGDDDGTGPGVN